MATKNIKKILLNKDGETFVADIENIENRITQNSSNLETAKQELSNKCDTVLSDAKAYTDTEKAKLFNSTNGTFTGSEYFRDVNNSVLRLNGGNTHDGGASLMLYGKNAYAPGHFDLVACTKEDASDAKQFVGRPDGSLTWNGVNLVPTGEIKWFAFNTVPYGYIICNGAKVSRTTYADLFKAIGTSFGSGDGSTTFDLPDLIDKFAQGSRTVGTYKGPGLPNITGDFALGNPNAWLGVSTASGVFTSDGGSTTQANQDGSGYSEKIQVRFNAKQYNPIYGNSETVQPPALTLLPCIKY